jgi:murein peptide amidase A
MQRLGKNNGGYFGECIDIASLLDEVRALGARHEWQADILPAGHGLELLALRRTVRQPAQRIYISTGIHGDEPAGPLAVRELLQQNQWPECADIWLCPCLNPTGFQLNKRECALGVDLNRDYRHLRSAEIQAHVRWLEAQPSFDFCLCLHEDWEAQGFYLYELNPDRRPSLAEHMITAVRHECPIDASAVIEGRDARDGIIRPGIDPSLRPDWPEAFYLITHKTRLSYTLESPSDFPLEMRVRALLLAVTAAIKGACDIKPALI